MPLVSVFTVRGAKSAGPVASTVTPGSTAPDVSLTVPVISWPNTAEGASTATAHTITIFASARISHPPSGHGQRQRSKNPRFGLQLVNEASRGVKKTSRRREANPRYLHETGSAKPARAGTHDYFAPGRPNFVGSTATFVSILVNFAVYRP